MTLPPPYSLAQCIARLNPSARSRFEDLRASVTDAKALQTTSQERIAATQEEYMRLQRRYARAVVPGGDGDEAKRLGAELAALGDKLERLERERAKRNSVAANTQRVIARLESFIEAWVGSIPSAIREPPRGVTVTPQLHDGESVSDAVTRLRNEIGKVRAELAMVRDAPLPSAEVKAALVECIDRMAMEGRPRISIEGTRATVHWPDMVEFSVPGQGALAAPSGGASKLMCWLHRDEIIDRFTADIPADIPGAIPTAERPERIRELEAKLFALEVSEEFFVGYAEELVKMLIDDGVILVEGERWRVLDERLSVARIPGTLTGVLQARLDALSAAERRAVQLASVVGPVFWDDALHALDPNAPAMLRALEQKAMVQARVESAFAGTREEAFQHHLLHQVTYDTVLKSDRREAHARTAAWLAARVGDREAEYLAVTAEHYERAGDQVPRPRLVRARRRGGRGALCERSRLDLPAAHARHARARRFAAPLEGGPDAGRRRRPDRRPRPPPRRGRRGDPDRRGARRRRVARLGGDVARRCSPIGWAIGPAPAATRSAPPSWPSVPTPPPRARSPTPSCPGWRASAATWRWRTTTSRSPCRLATRAAQQMKSPNDDIYEVLLRLVAAQLHQSEHDFDRQLQLAEEARVLAEQRGQRRLLCSSHESLALWALNVLDTDRAARHLDDTGGGRP